jgi:hypothetical protein
MPSIGSSVDRRRVAPSSIIGTTLTDWPLLSFGYSSASERPIASMSLLACASVTSFRSRPIAMNEFDPRSSSPLVQPAGTHSCRSMPNWNRNHDGMTPITVWVRESIGMGRPTIDGSPA